MFDQVRSRGDAELPFRLLAASVITALLASAVSCCGLFAWLVALLSPDPLPAGVPEELAVLELELIELPDPVDEELVAPLLPEEVGLPPEIVAISKLSTLSFLSDEAAEPKGVFASDIGLLAALSDDRGSFMSVISNGLSHEVAATGTGGGLGMQGTGVGGGGTIDGIGDQGSIALSSGTGSSLHTSAPSGRVVSVEPVGEPADELGARRLRARVSPSVVQSCAREHPPEDPVEITVLVNEDGASADGATGLVACVNEAAVRWHVDEGTYRIVLRFY